mmetsp:Transcript_1122/g.2363  ORF Transcript_1122/g.2363 Transcript_1122/m.2363 type:complete len:227 (-) Transcript_1122:1073-1753(-)
MENERSYRNLRQRKPKSVSVVYRHAVGFSGPWTVLGTSGVVVLGLLCSWWVRRWTRQRRRRGWFQLSRDQWTKEGEEAGRRIRGMDEQSPPLERIGTLRGKMRKDGSVYSMAFGNDTMKQRRHPVHSPVSNGVAPQDVTSAFRDSRAEWEAMTVRSIHDSDKTNIGRTTLASTSPDTLQRPHLGPWIWAGCKMPFLLVLDGVIPAMQFVLLWWYDIQVRHLLRPST